MIKKRITVPLDLVDLNKGQIPWLPTNPRKWTKDDLRRMAASLDEDPDYIEDRPLDVLLGPDGRYVVFAGNLRSEGAKKAGWKEAPAYLYMAESDEDRQTVKRRAMKDNGSFGAFDWDLVANEWDDGQLLDWGVPVWQAGAKGMGTGDSLSSEGMEGDEDYDAFVDKFKTKLTTDDCFTPPAVYDAVLRFVGSIYDLEGKTIERPFVPGGDYERYQYTPRSVVVDNPPFSLLSKICRFYSAKQIPFFIFAPALTLFTATDCDLTYIVSDSDIIYENGASVRTGFITNMIQDVRIWCCPELRDALIEAQPDEDKTKQGFVYPDNIVTAAILGKITKRSVELKIRKISCEPIHESDSAREQGRRLFGGGFIMSDSAAAERAAAERATAERAAATRLNISDREREIIERLNEQEQKYATL